jgi:hypothetical protein
MQNHARTGGILSVISGVFGILGLFVFVLVAAVLVYMPGEINLEEFGLTEELLSFVAVMYIVMGIICALLGVLAIVGGVFALKKKRWGWALAGSIGGLLAFFPCGIPALIYVIMGKNEFIGSAPVPPAPVQTVAG